MTNRLAAEYNWEGKLRNNVKKESFSKTNIAVHLFGILNFNSYFFSTFFYNVLYSSIEAAVRIRFPNATDYEMEEYVKDWLRHAPARKKTEDAAAVRAAAARDAAQQVAITAAEQVPNIDVAAAEANAIGPVPFNAAQSAAAASRLRRHPANRGGLGQ